MSLFSVAPEDHAGLRLNTQSTRQCMTSIKTPGKMPLNLKAADRQRNLNIVVALLLCCRRSNAFRKPGKFNTHIVHKIQGSGDRAPRIARVIMSEVGDFPSTKTLAVHLPQRPCVLMFVMLCTQHREMQLAVRGCVVLHAICCIFWKSDSTRGGTVAQSRVML